MAQSRMAGMAMDLGPSDLADVGEAATMATNKMGMEQGQQSSLIMNLEKGITSARNDGDPKAYIQRYGQTKVLHDDMYAYPLNNVPHGTVRTMREPTKSLRQHNKIFDVMARNRDSHYHFDSKTGYPSGGSRGRWMTEY